jgi:hypothetical protein
MAAFMDTEKQPKSKEEKILSLTKLIAEHNQWIQSHSYDCEGVKERKEWIYDCELELSTLQGIL